MIRKLFALVLAAFALAAAAPPAERRVALTFDDVPRQAGAFLTPEERARRLIEALQAAGVEQAAFFVNPGRLASPDGVNGEAHIAAYVAAGHVIANHSHSHPHLSTTSAEDYLADIDRAGQWLAGRAGYRPWFRFPYLDEGGADMAKRDAVRAGLAARRLMNGYVTADGNDWHLEALAAEAVRAGRTLDMAQLRRLYIASQMSGLEYHDQLARDTLGRSPAHVMLMHETDLAALFLPDLVAEMRRHGWTIITADAAYRDPIAAEQPEVPYARGTLTGAMAWQRDVPPPLWPVWMKTAMITQQFEALVVRRSEDP